MLVPPGASVLATSHIVPHLSHRRNVGLIDTNTASETVRGFEFVAVDPIGCHDDTQRPSSIRVREQLLGAPDFEVVFDRAGVTLFKRR